MLSDPISVTIDGSAKSLARVGGSLTSPQPRKVSRNVYRTADGAYTVDIQQFEHRDGTKTAELMLRKVVRETDSATAFDGYYVSGVGLKFETGPFGLGVSDIPNVRTALLALVDSALQSRIIAGEA